MSPPSNNTLIKVHAKPFAVEPIDKPQRRPVFVPRFFGWVDSIGRTVHREIAGEPYEPLSKEEMSLLTIFFARTTIEHLARQRSDQEPSKRLFMQRPKRQA